MPRKEPELGIEIPDIPFGADTPDKVFGVNPENANEPGAGPIGGAALPTPPAAEGLGTNNAHAEAPTTGEEINVEALKRGEPWGIRIGDQQVCYQIVTEGGALTILTALEGENLRPMVNTTEGLEGAVGIIEQDIMQRTALARDTIKPGPAHTSHLPPHLDPTTAPKAPAGLPGTIPEFQRITFRGQEVVQGDTVLFVPADRARGTRAARIAAIQPSVQGETFPRVTLTITNPEGFPTLDLKLATRNIPLYLEGDEVPAGARVALVRKQAERQGSDVSIEAVREAVKAGVTAYGKALSERIDTLDARINDGSRITNDLEQRAAQLEQVVGMLRSTVDALQKEVNAFYEERKGTSGDASGDAGKKSQKR
jgi:hypothetical protein